MIRHLLPDADGVVQDLPSTWPGCPRCATCSPPTDWTDIPSTARLPLSRLAAMTSYISHTTVDCHNAYELSQWWKEVLGYVDIPDDPNEPGHPECMIQSPEADHQLLFIEVPDTKSVKNRVHFDLRPSAGTRDEEVARLLGIGATEVDDQRNHYGPGVGWVVMADPEGNEFCVLRSEAERAAADG